MEEEEDKQNQEEGEPGFSHLSVFGDDTEYIDYIQCPFPNCSALFLDDGKGFLIRACPKCCKIFCVKCQVRWHMDRNCHKNTLGEKIAIRILTRPKSDQNYDSDPKLGIEVSERFPVLESRQIQEVIHYELRPYSSYEYGESSNSQISSSELFSWDEDFMSDQNYDSPSMDNNMGSYDPTFEGVPVLDFGISQFHSIHEYGESSNSQISSSESNWEELLGLQLEYIQCPFPNCSALFLDDGEGFLIRACPICWKIFCMKCRVRWHMDLKCKARFERNNRRSKRKYGQEERRELKKSPLGIKRLRQFL